MSAVEIFCRQIRSRSQEHKQAFFLMHGEELLSQQISILRQELDSMIRVIFLLKLKDNDRRVKLIEQAINGEIWRNEHNKGRITDREMVDLASQLQGWTSMVYRFGCAFIHLSQFHDYQDRELLETITPQEKQDLLEYMGEYHFFRQENPTLKDLLPYLPSVFEKISSNLEIYIKDLEYRK